MKRYILFTFTTIYPSGGWDDYDGDYDTFDEAMAALKSKESKFNHSIRYQIVDIKTGEKVGFGTINNV